MHCTLSGNVGVPKIKEWMDDMRLALGRSTSLVCFCLILAVAGPSYALKRTGKERTLEDLTKQSDSVVVGTCKAKNVNWVGGNLETQYEVEVSEQLKGTKNRPGKMLMTTMPGGESTTPPLTQLVQYTAHMYVGEDVVLFLKDSPPQPSPSVRQRMNSKSTAWSGPWLFAWNEGKFSVVTDKATGQRKITRVNLEDYGIAPQDASMRSILHAVATGGIKTVNQPVVEIGGGVATTPQGKAIYDHAAAARASQQSVTTPAFAKGIGSLPIQDFDEFKAQVRRFAE